MKRPLMLLTSLLFLGACSPEAQRQEQADAISRIESKLPDGCVFRDLGNYSRPYGANMPVLAVLCKSTTTTSYKVPSGKTSYDLSVTTNND